jgi:hypothetical protein
VCLDVFLSLFCLCACEGPLVICVTMPSSRRCRCYAADGPSNRAHLPTRCRPATSAASRRHVCGCTSATSCGVSRSSSSPTRCCAGRGRRSSSSPRVRHPTCPPMEPRCRRRCACCGRTCGVPSERLARQSRCVARLCSSPCACARAHAMSTSDCVRFWCMSTCAVRAGLRFISCFVVAGFWFTGRPRAIVVGGGTVVSADPAPQSLRLGLSWIPQLPSPSAVSRPAAVTALC